MFRGPLKGLVAGWVMRRVSNRYRRWQAANYSATSAPNLLVCLRGHLRPSFRVVWGAQQRDKVELLEREWEKDQDNIMDLRKRLAAEQGEQRQLQRRLMSPEKLVEVAPRVEVLQRRLEMAEGRIATLATFEKPQEALGEVRAGGAPLTKLSKGFRVR